MKNNILTIKYEELIGKKGNGDEKDQIKTCIERSDYLDLPEGKIEFVKNNVIGESPTFRKGKLNTWEKEIPVNLMKDVNGQLYYILKLWNYE